MGYINNATWTRYKNILREFHDDAMQMDVIWKRSVTSRTRLTNDAKTVDVTIQGLVQYNHFRNWPINKTEVTGEVDKESVLLYLNQEWLSEQGYLDINKQFKFDPGYDRFFIEGIEYKSAGESKAAQTKDDTILVFIILQREDISNTN